MDAVRLLKDSVQDSTISSVSFCPSDQTLVRPENHSLAGYSEKDQQWIGYSQSETSVHARYVLNRELETLFPKEDIFATVVDTLTKGKFDEEKEGYYFAFGEDVRPTFAAYTGRTDARKASQRLSAVSYGRHLSFGADVLAMDGERRVCVQCKRYAPGHPVGVKAVQEIYSAKDYYGCDDAYIYTTSDFTKAAVNMAAELGVILVRTDI